MTLWKRDIDWMNEAAQRIGCHGLAGWLPDFAAWAELMPAECPPSGLVSKMAYVSASRGLKMLLLYPFAERASSADPQTWVLHGLEIDAASLALPFGLDAAAETPQSARHKLGDDTAFGRSVDFRDGNYRVVHYMPDGRVVGVAFKSTLAGIESLHLQRIVTMPDFRTQERMA